MTGGNFSAGSASILITIPFDVLGAVTLETADLRPRGGLSIQRSDGRCRLYGESWLANGGWWLSFSCIGNM